MLLFTETRIFPLKQKQTDDTLCVRYNQSNVIIVVRTLKCVRFLGGLARLVFISYDNIGQLLVPEDDDTGDVVEKQLISRVVSASIAQKSDDEELSKPITFTMNTQDVSTFRSKNVVIL